MPTPLYKEDIIPAQNRAEITTMADGDIFVVSKDKALKKITKANVKETLGINANTTDIASNEARIDTAEDDITQLELDLADAELGIANNESAIVDIQAKDVVLENQTVKNSSDIKNVNEVISKLATTEDSITDEGIASVAISKQALSGACKVVKSGKSFTNLVDGQGVLDTQSVSFESVLNHSYYDWLHNIKLVGTGSTMTVTNDTGSTANIMVFDLTAEGHTLLTADEVLAYNPIYHDSVAHTDGKGCLLSKNEDETISNKFFYEGEQLGDLPNGVQDKMVDINGVLTLEKNVEKEYVLQASDITSAATTPTNVDYVVTTAFGDKNTESSTSSTVGTTVVDGHDEVANNATIFDDINYIGYFANRSDGKMLFVVEKGTTLAEARADLAGTIIRYQLAEPIYTPIPTVGLLQAYQSGATFDLPQDKILFKYDGNPVGATGITSLLELSEYDPINNIETTLDASLATIGVDSFTHPSLITDTWYIAEYEYSREVEGDIDIISRNNDKYKIDTVTSDMYKVEIIVSNGVPSLQATLV